MPRMIDPATGKVVRRDLFYGTKNMINLCDDDDRKMPAKPSIEDQVRQLGLRSTEKQSKIDIQNGIIGCRLPSGLTQEWANDSNNKANGSSKQQTKSTASERKKKREAEDKILAHRIKKMMKKSVEKLVAKSPPVETIAKPPTDMSIDVPQNFQPIKLEDFGDIALSPDQHTSQIQMSPITTDPHEETTGSSHSSESGLIHAGTLTQDDDGCMRLWLDPKIIAAFCGQGTSI